MSLGLKTTFTDVNLAPEAVIGRQFWNDRSGAVTRLTASGDPSKKADVHLSLNQTVRFEFRAGR